MQKAMTFIGLFLLLFCQVSCSKSNSDDTTNSKLDSELSCDIDGKHIVFSGETGLGSGPGVRVTKIRTDNPNTTRYSFQGLQNSENFAIIDVYTDSLKIGRYELTQGVSTITVNGVQYKNGLTDALALNITSYQKGIVNGSFSGTLAKATGPNTWDRVNVLNGVLKDVRVIY